VKYLFFIFLNIVYIQQSHAEFNDQEALQYTTRAVLATKEGKKTKEYAENEFYKKTKIPKQHAAIISGTTATTINLIRNERFSTKYIKNVNIKFSGVEIRPDFEYNGKTNTYMYSIGVDYDF